VLRLSEKYVRSLAHETHDVIDGPYAGRLTGYGMFILDQEPDLQIFHKLHKPCFKV